MNRILHNSISGLTRYSVRLSVLFAALVVLGSCIRDGQKDNIDPESEPTEVNIAISVPYPVIATRSLNKDDEEAVNTVELLVFDSSGEYLYTSEGYDVTVDSDPSIRNFKAILKSGQADILLLANCRDILAECYPYGIVVGTPRSEVIANIALQLSAGWVTDKSSADYRDIPMWGDIGSVYISAWAPPFDNTVYQISRMVARIDVTTSLADPSQFRMTSVRLYYYNDAGRVVPAALDHSAGKPSLPTGVNKVKGPVVYGSSSIKDEPGGGQSCVREIYLFEALAGSRAGHPYNTCLVIGGEYKGVAGFYRLDLQQVTPSGKTYLDILRNHHYQVIITAVDDIGYTDPDEALEAFPVGIESQVIDWQQEFNDEISIGGNYILKLSTDELVFTPAGGTKYMYIYTNHPSGWKFVEDNFIPSVSWLTFDRVAGNQGDFTQVKVTAEEYAGDNLRMYEFPLIVDNVSKGLMFAQLGTNEVELEIFATPNPMLLRNVMTEPVTLTVSTYPTGLPLSFSYTGNITWQTGYGIPADGTTLRTFQLMAEPNVNNDELSGTLTIYVRDAAGHIASTTVEISQFNKITGFRTVLDNPYPAQAGTYKFQVESVVPWQVDAISDGSIWAPSFGMSVQPATGLTDKDFTLTNNPKYEPRNIDVTFLAPETGQAQDVRFEQDFVPPQLILTDGTTLMLPGEGGQTVKYKFKANANWNVTIPIWTAVSSVYSTLTNSGGTGVAYDLKEYELEFVTNGYTANSNVPAAGRTVGGYATIEITDYDPYTLTSAEYQQRVLVSRVVPPLVFPGTTRYQRFDTDAATNYVPIAPVADEKFLGMLACGETTLEFNAYINCSVKAWSSLDPSYIVTYNHTSLQMNTSANFRFPIPANPGTGVRDFVIYMQPEGYGTEELKEFHFKQNGTRVKVTLVSPATLNVPTGGVQITVNVEDPDGILSNTNRLLFTFLDENDNYIEPVPTVLTSITTTSATSGIVTAPGLFSTLHLKPHPGEPQQPRKVTLVYGLELANTGSTTYGVRKLLTTIHRVAEFTQDYRSHRFPANMGGHLISRSNIQDNSSNFYYYGQALANWSIMMGINENTYQTTSFWNTNPQWNYGTFQTLTGAQMPAFSCAAYEEPDHPGVQWRLPTLAELQYMYDNRETIGGFHTGTKSSTYNNYWSIQEAASDMHGSVSYFDFMNGVPVQSASKIGYLVGYSFYAMRGRCVEKIQPPN